MTVIRLTRMGRKKQPFYRIAVTDSRKRRDGGFFPSFCQALAEDRVTSPTKKKNGSYRDSATY